MELRHDVVTVWNDDDELEGYAILDRETWDLVTGRLYSTRSSAWLARNKIFGEES